MGSIADLLGDQLPPEWREQAEEPPSLAEEVELASQDLPEETAERGPRGIVLAAVLEETGYEAENVRETLSLEDDLELTGLPLWSVVARVERDLAVTFPDTQVEAWRTLGDMLEAALQ